MNRDIQVLTESYAWESVNKSTIVDVGGGSGHISMSLAKVSYSAANTALPTLETLNLTLTQCSNFQALNL